jgi:hypothetical protein
VVPEPQDLQPQRPALHLGGRRADAGLRKVRSGISCTGHQRGRLGRVAHRRRHVVLHAQRADDPSTSSFDVRVPTHRRRLLAAADQMAMASAWATAGRTTLTGEGWHADGHSCCWRRPTRRWCPTPAFAYEIAYRGKRPDPMYGENPENIYFYITIYNEPYRQPARQSRRRGLLRASTATGPRRSGGPTSRRSWPRAWPCPALRAAECWPTNGTSPPTCGR